MNEVNNKKLKNFKKNGEYFVVLARKDQDGNFCPSNIFFRKPLTEREKLMGLEEWHPNEPIDLPMSEEDIRERRDLSERERAYFDVWYRINWRCGPLATEWINDLSKEFGGDNEK